MGQVELVSTFLAGSVGALTTTGSLVAFGKLSTYMDSKPLQLSARDPLNASLVAATLGSGAIMATTSDPSIGLCALSSASITSGLLGWHATASIGGADMPVVVTLLNSYSGWALCAEGFLMNEPVLTTVGRLIGCSGAALTQIMCKAMNRNVTSVIMGGFGTQTKTSTKSLDEPDPVVINVQDTIQAIENATFHYHCSWIWTCRSTSPIWSF